MKRDSTKLIGSSNSLSTSQRLLVLLDFIWGHQSEGLALICKVTKKKSKMLLFLSYQDYALLWVGVYLEMSKMSIKYMKCRRCHF